MQALPTFGVNRPNHSAFLHNFHRKKEEHFQNVVRTDQENVPERRVESQQLAINKPKMYSSVEAIHTIAKDHNVNIDRTFIVKKAEG